MDDLNLVQLAPKGLESAVPLVLIHDGGGTAVSYYYLDSLDRPVYAIQNPHFYTGEEWEDGLPELGEVYAKTILSEIPSGQIILGGWSLGGMISLEVASALSRSSSLQVIGVVMIDSVFPIASPTKPRTVVQHETKFGERATPETRRLVAQCMKNAISMAKRWTPPVWKGCTDEATYAYRVELEEKLFKKLQGASWRAGEGKKLPISELARPPQTVLLRCNEYVPVPTSDVADGVSRVDMLRDLKKIGWEQYGYDLITAVLDIPGNHFNIFDNEFLGELTSRVKLACKMLERANI